MLQALSNLIKGPSQEEKNALSFIEYICRIAYENSRQQRSHCKDKGCFWNIEKSNKQIRKNESRGIIW